MPEASPMSRLSTGGTDFSLCSLQHPSKNLVHVPQLQFERKAARDSLRSQRRAVRAHSMTPASRIGYTEHTMRLSAGDKLGPYEILAGIGAGGMGEVYRAHDPRLRRDVAIKVSAERFSERFLTEARAIASLNHPNVCTLHDVG